MSLHALYSFTRPLGASLFKRQVIASFATFRSAVGQPWLALRAIAERTACRLPRLKRGLRDSDGSPPLFVSRSEDGLGQSFDLLARALAAGLSRRQAFAQIGAFIVADLIGRPLRIAPAAAQAAACNPTGLTQCYQSAQGDYGNCVNDCPAGSSACRASCAGQLAREKRDCDAEYGPCSSGMICCSGECTDPVSDPQNCGACGNVCPNGVCTTAGCSCPPGFTVCGAICYNLSNDPHHCGSCGKACPAPANSTPTCTNQVCGFACDSGFFACGNACCPTARTCCNGACTDLTSDIQNCGTCGKSCTDQQVCQDGACITKSCDTGQLHQCYLPAQDDYGNCVNDCPAGSSACRGSCARQLAKEKRDCDASFSCPSSLSCCGSTCKNFVTDLENCGACNHPCPVPANSSPTCTNGACGFICNAGFFACGDHCCTAGAGAICCNGTCTNLNSDVQNCGSCNNVCPAPANSSPTCANGVCGFVCIAGFTQCGNTCHDLITDPNDCGACDKVCAGPANSRPTCANSLCGFLCDPGHPQCGNICCPSGPANSSPTCTNGVCGFICNSGYTRCGNICAYLPGDLQNCGRCGNACPAGTGCCNGQCTSLSTNQNCGTCGNICRGNLSCRDGVCLCPSGLLKCSFDFCCSTPNQCCGTGCAPSGQACCGFGPHYCPAGDPSRGIAPYTCCGSGQNAWCCAPRETPNNVGVGDGLAIEA
jgi:hypothetical protein